MICRVLQDVIYMGSLPPIKNMNIGSFDLLQEDESDKFLASRDDLILPR